MTPIKFGTIGVIIMLETWIRKATPALITIFTLALTVGTVFAQEAEESSTPAGLSMAVLLLGLVAIFVIFLATWSRSAPDENDPS